MNEKVSNEAENPALNKGAVMPSLHTWTDADIDAAYIMGAINADAVKADDVQGLCVRAGLLSNNVNLKHER